MKNLFYILTFFLFISCHSQRIKDIQQTVLDWQGKEIQIPNNIEYFNYSKEGKDVTNMTPKYKILSYIDSTGCVRCKWKLIDWKEFIEYTDSISNKDVSFQFVVNNTNKEKIQKLLRDEMFDYPIYLDTADIINKVNKFPTDERLCTFLLDENNKVILVGNPILSKSVKKLYIETILSGTIQ